MARYSSVIQEDCESIVNEMVGPMRAFAKSRILVTGGGGFLGSYFLDVLFNYNRLNPENKCQVFCFDNFRTGLPERISHLKQDPNFLFENVDVSKEYKIPENLDFIVHAASVASPTFYREFPLETIDVNVNGTRFLLEHAKNNPSIKSVLYMSTSEIYGNPSPDHIPTKEDYYGYVPTMGPRACYDESKRLGETLCWIYHTKYNVPVNIARIFNCFGPGQRIDDKRIIPDLISAAIANKDIELFSDGGQTRSFSYIKDTVRGFFYILLSNLRGEVFNVGNMRELSIGDVAKHFQTLVKNQSMRICFKENSDPHYLVDSPQRRCPDVGKLKSLTKWSPSVPLEEGLARTLRYYQETAQP